MIAIADPDILKQILVKDFENFRSRKVSYFILNQIKLRLIQMFFSRYIRRAKYKGTLVFHLEILFHFEILHETHNRYVNVQPHMHDTCRAYWG